MDNKAEHIMSMVKSKGWQYLHEWLITQIDYYRNKLEICPLEELKEVRGIIKGYRNVLKITNAWIEEGKK